MGKEQKTPHEICRERKKQMNGAGQKKKRQEAKLLNKAHLVKM